MPTSAGVVFNEGGQYQLTARPIAPSTASAGATDSVMAIDFTSNGRPGARELELDRLTLMLSAASGAPMTTEEARMVIQSVDVYRAFGDENELEDELVWGSDDWQFENGRLSIEFDRLDPRVRVSAEQTARFYVTLTWKDFDRNFAVDQLRITHIAQGIDSSRARDVATGVAVTAVHPTDVATSPISVPRSGRTLGDANGDGEFNRLDIVHLLQRARYLHPTDAGWEDGDWNGDRRFDQIDLVFALQFGGYVSP